jgi:hypothetical protein
MSHSNRHPAVRWNRFRVLKVVHFDRPATIRPAVEIELRRKQVEPDDALIKLERECVLRGPGKRDVFQIRRRDTHGLIAAIQMMMQTGTFSLAMSRSPSSMPHQPTKV